MSEPLTIVVDATAISARGKGLSRYALSLVEALAAIDPYNRFVVLLRDEEELPPVPVAGNFSYIRVASRPMLVWQLVRLPKLLRRIRCDVVHVIGEIGPVWSGPPMVLTVTELPGVRNRLNRPTRLYARVSHALYEAFFPICLRRAHRLLAISDATRDAVVAELGLPPDKIETTPLAADAKFCSGWSSDELAAFRNKIGSEAGYALVFATGDGREDTLPLLQVWRSLVRDSALPQMLVVAGCRGEEIRARLRAHIEQLGIAERVVVLGYVEEEEMPTLYAAADCYIDTSRYEGFGLQSLEALACGTCVVAWDIPAIAEVVQDAAILLPPGDVPALEEALRQVLTDHELRGELAARGIARASDFSWTRTGELTLRAYRTAIHS